MVVFNTTFSKQYFPRLPGGVGDCPGAPDLSKPQKYYKREKNGGKKAPKYNCAAGHQKDLGGSVFPLFIHFNRGIQGFRRHWLRGCKHIGASARPAPFPILFPTQVH
jgi:hypothetical protein